MKIIVFSLLILLPILFQNCSRANFLNTDAFSGKRQAAERDLICSNGLCEDIGSDEFDEGLITVDENTRNETTREDEKPMTPEVSENTNPIPLIEYIFEVENLDPVNSETCGELFLALQGMDVQGQDVKINGNYQKVIIRNAGKVKINGNMEILVVDGASEISINGNVGSLCVKAHYIEKVNGNLGSSDQVQLLIGQILNERKAVADQISGNTKVSTFIYDIDTDKINGGSQFLYVKNSATRKINGNVRDLTLEQSTLEELSGNVSNLLLKDSSIQKINGHIRNLEYEGRSSILEVNGNIN